MFRASDLVDVESWARYDISPPGSDHRRFQELSMVSGSAGLAEVPGFDATRVEVLLAALRDPEIHIGEMTVVGVRGYRRQ